MAYSQIEHGAPFTLQELYPSSPFFKETVSLRVTGMLRGYSIETAIGVIEDGGRSLKINTQHLRDVFNMQMPSRSRLELFETQALPTEEEFDVIKNASRTALAVIVILLHPCLDMKPIILGKYHYVLYFLVLAMQVAGRVIDGD